MKLILNIEDNKADFVLELLKNFSFIEVEMLSNKNAIFLKELNESINEVNMATQGKVQLKSAEEILNEL